jgi:hypothetical protein
MLSDALIHGGGRGHLVQHPPLVFARVIELSALRMGTLVQAPTVCIVLFVSFESEDRGQCIDMLIHANLARIACVFMPVKYVTLNRVSVLTSRSIGKSCTCIYEVRLDDAQHFRWQGAGSTNKWSLHTSTGTVGKVEERLIALVVFLLYMQR